MMFGICFDDMARVLGRLLRERANMSSCIVVIYFAVVFVIVLTQIFLIDQSKRARRTDSHVEDYQDIPKNRRFLQNLEQNFTAAFKLNANISIQAKDCVWQTVAGNKYKFFVYSAYYDWRGSRMVRVIGATKTRRPESVWCFLWYNSPNNTHIVTVKAKVKVIREHGKLKYSACFILCTLPGNLSVPHSVSIIRRSNVTLLNRVIVNHAYPEIKPKPIPPPNKIAVCVKPLHSTYNLSLQMLEFIEFNSLLGMDHITFYNSSISSTTNCILNHYIREGRVTVLPWKLDMVSFSEIRIEGIFAALNDCLYRNMYRFSYVALVDIDEIVMPKYNDTIQEFIKWMSAKKEGNAKSIGSYSFQNAFFYLQWPDEVIISDEPFESSLTPLRKTRRLAKLHPHNQRSKYVCRPEFVIEAGNHFVWEFVPGHVTFPVPSNAAILNHYRVCEYGGDSCIKSASVIDRTAYRYKKRLVERIRAKWTELKLECLLPDIVDAQIKKRD